MKTSAAQDAFTLGGLLSIVCILGLLLGVFARAWPGGRRESEALRCLTNLRSLGAGVHLYTEENNDVFPAHRKTNNDGQLTGWWGTDILGYVEDGTNAFRCPALKRFRVERGTRWQWRFDVNEVGYGYNAFFLGLSPYENLIVTLGGIQFSPTPTFKRASVVKPSENILIGGRTPSGNPPMWGSMLWWPNACMDPQRSSIRAYEGVETERHSERGGVVFNDGHVELRRDAQINPPYDPNSGNPRALTNANFWDPLRRGH